MKSIYDSFKDEQGDYMLTRDGAPFAYTASGLSVKMILLELRSLEAKIKELKK